MSNVSQNSAGGLGGAGGNSSSGFTFDMGGAPPKAAEEEKQPFAGPSPRVQMNPQVSASMATPKPPALDDGLLGGINLSSGPPKPSSPKI